MAPLPNSVFGTADGSSGDQGGGGGGQYVADMLNRRLRVRGRGASIYRRYAVAPLPNSVFGTADGSSGDRGGGGGAICSRYVESSIACQRAWCEWMDPRCKNTYLRCPPFTYVETECGAL